MMKRIIKFEPAYDHGKEGGVHGVELTFTINGVLGAVEFGLFTNWMLPETRERMERDLLDRAHSYGVRRYDDERELTLAMLSVGVEQLIHNTQIEPVDKTLLKVCYHPIAALLAIHSPEPLYEGHTMAGSVRTVVTPRANESSVAIDEAGGMTPHIPFDIETTDTGTFAPCEYLGTHPCYYSSQVTAADAYLDTLIRKGSDALWQQLEMFYMETFFKE